MLRRVVASGATVLAITIFEIVELAVLVPRGSYHWLQPFYLVYGLVLLALAMPL